MEDKKVFLGRLTHQSIENEIQAAGLDNFPELWYSNRAPGVSGAVGDSPKHIITAMNPEIAGQAG